MKSDLVVVVADGGIEQTIRGILQNPEKARIRPVSGLEIPKLHKMDSGVFHDGHKLVELYKNTHEFALLVLDFAWEGRPTDDPAELSRIVEDNLRPVWGERGRCIVIVPELENWIWSDSPHVARALGWDSMDQLRLWLEAQGQWQPGDLKPGDPKKAFELAIREKKIQKSNAIFFDLAAKVSYQRCSDESFRRLLAILQEWFPK